MKKERRSGGGNNRSDPSEDDEGGYTRFVHDDSSETGNGVGSATTAGEELRLYVFREVLMAGWYPRSPRLDEARPEHFPRELTVFHTGGLYAHIQTRAMATLLQFYNRVHLIAFLALLLAFMVAYWDSPLLFYTQDDGTRSMNFVSYWIHAVGVYVISNAVSYALTRRAVNNFHEKVDAVVKELSPVYRRAGYDLEYCASSWTTNVRSQDRSLLSKCGAGVASLLYNESYVRFVPYKGEISSDDIVKASALWDMSSSVSGAATTTTTTSDATVAPTTAPPPPPPVGFSVAVYGRPACPGPLVGSGHGGGGSQEGSSFFSHLPHSWDHRQKDKVDLFTRGAVATEMRRYSDMYRRARLCIIVGAVLVSQVPMWLPDSFYDKWWLTLVLLGCLSTFLVIMLCPTGLETWWLVHVLRQPVLDQLRATIEHLSPLVEDRSGYSLRLQVEPDGCFGGTAAYVHFEPKTSSPASGGCVGGRGPEFC